MGRWALDAGESALGPEPASPRARGALIRDVGGAVAAVGDGESVCHHGTTEVGSRRLNACHCSSMDIDLNRERRSLADQRSGLRGVRGRLHRHAGPFRAHRCREVAQNKMRNAIDDYFFDVLRDQKGIDLPVEAIDDLEQKIMGLARARFPE